ncbi:hypothetical protein LWF15_13185 [Kineosporia rhizophila]|uniref:glycosyl hydrolase n=1 Tax=Kineosporia rhizophila TaxID=84633 RepID=UPI001E467D26|nr:glycosyl hydrolase [Kineosporia rhizophila]MCE0536466.1 hypothetical protein [Kineosporia rhizophila]
MRARQRRQAPARRRLGTAGALTASTTLALALFGLPAEAADHRSPAHDFVAGFKAADSSYGAMFRWWWPSSVEASTAVEQLREVAEAGYKGVEIAMVMDGTDYVVDPGEHEYGDANWRAAVQAVLTEAQRLDVQVDLTLGSRWPAAVPGLDVSDDAASQELVTGSAVVAAGQAYRTDLPRPAARTYAERRVENGKVVTTTKTSVPTYVTATATRCVASCTEKQPQLDLTTVTDLSGSVKAGKVSWTAPKSGTWMVTSYWKRGTAQRNDAPFGETVSPLSEPESRVVNHLDKAGAEQFIAYFDGLLDQRTRQLLKANGGSIFEDSLELSGAQLWTRDFRSAFRRVSGYSLDPYLPVLARTAPASPFAAPTPVYSFAEGQDQVGERLQHDIDATISELYLGNHVTPIQAWANRLGLKFRAQPYGEPIDLGDAAQKLDITECESLGCSESRMRTSASSVALAGKRVVSSEMLPGGFGNLYGLTQAQIVALANREYALGTNQMVFHGLPYPTMPPSADGTITDSAAYWPGFHGFGSNIGEAFGPRQPSWTMEKELAAYYSRMQQVLQTGRARYDIAVLNQTFGADEPSHDGSFLVKAGYTYGYVTPGALDQLSASDGYRALVLDDSPMSLETAGQVARLVRSGLPVFFVGGTPEHTIGYAASAAKAAKDDAALQAVFERLGNRVTVVADDAAVTAGLAEQKVRPSADIADRAVHSVLRAEKGVSYYVLVNTGDKDVETTADLAGTGSRRYVLDPWTGEVTAAGKKIALDAGAATIIVLADRDWATTRPQSTQTEGSGTELADWTLTLDEWLPGESGDSSATTRHREHIIKNVPLVSWTQIPEIKDAVGVGSYTTTFTAPSTGKADGAVLDLGAVAGSYQVFVNGKQAQPADQLSSRIDLGNAVRPGQNTLTVKVAVPLLNQLRVHRPKEFGERKPTTNGLLGPVTLRTTSS